MLQPLNAALVRPEHGDELIIAPHHPDRLRRPRPRHWASDHERRRHALVWNVFRTLELLPPAFWLRRLQARLLGTSVPTTPETVRIALWQPLPLPPARQLDGALPEVVVDVVVETETAVWTLIVPDDRYWGDESGQVADVIDAGVWFAGARDHFCGIVEAATSERSIGSVLKERYSRSRQSAHLRSASPTARTPTTSGIGTLEWADLQEILGDCAEADSLADIERALARNVLDWLEQAA